MSSRSSRLKVAAGRGGRRLPAIGLLVLVGLAVSGLANLFLIDPPGDGALPGVALGSRALVVVERAVAFFAVWLLVLVVVAQAFRGRLPIEVSGRGVRYADAHAAGDAASESEQAFDELNKRVAVLEGAVLMLSRYAMLGGRDGH